MNVKRLKSLILTDEEGVKSYSRMKGFIKYCPGDWEDQDTQ